MRQPTVFEDLETIRLALDRGEWMAMDFAVRDYAEAAVDRLIALERKRRRMASEEQGILGGK